MERSDEKYEWKLLEPTVGHEMNMVSGGLHGHSSVYYNGCLWIYGGSNGGWTRNNMFCFNLKESKWREVHPKGDPLPVNSDHAAVVFRDKMFIFGGRGHARRRNGVDTGENQTIYNTVYIFDFETETITKESTLGDTPSPRKAFPLVVWRDRMYVLGGWNNQLYFNDMYYLELDAQPKYWHKINYDETILKIEPRCEHVGVSFNDKLYYWCGTTGMDMSTFTMKHLSQTLVFDPYKNTFEELQTTGDKPPVAEGQRAVIHKNFMYVLGGHNTDNYYNELYKFDCAKHHWSKVNVVIPKSFIKRACFTLDMTAYGDDEDVMELFVIGGFSLRELGPNEVDDDATYPERYIRLKDVHSLKMNHDHTS